MRHVAADWKRKARNMADFNVLIKDGDALHLMHCRGKVVGVAKYSVTGLVPRIILNIAQDEREEQLSTKN